jgi:hypothetical protein
MYSPKKRTRVTEITIARTGSTNFSRKIGSACEVQRSVYFYLKKQKDVNDDNDVLPLLQHCREEE